MKDAPQNQNSKYTHRFFIVIGVAALLLFLYFAFGGTDEKVIAEKAKRELVIKNANERQLALAISNKQKDSIIQAQNTLIKKADEAVKNAISRKLKIQKHYESLIANVKSLNNAQIAQFYIQRYNAPDHIKSVEYGTQLSDSVAKLNISDLLGGDQAIKVLDLTENELHNTQSIVSSQDTIIKAHQEKEGNFNMMLAEKDKIIVADQNLIDAQAKSLRKKKVGNAFWKTTAVAAGTYILIGLIKK